MVCIGNSFSAQRKMYVTGFFTQFDELVCVELKVVIPFAISEIAKRYYNNKLIADLHGRIYGF